MVNKAAGSDVTQEKDDPAHYNQCPSATTASRKRMLVNDLLPTLPTLCQPLPSASGCGDELEEAVKTILNTDQRAPTAGEASGDISTGQAKITQPLSTTPPRLEPSTPRSIRSTSRSPSKTSPSRQPTHSQGVRVRLPCVNSAGRVRYPRTRIVTDERKSPRTPTSRGPSTRDPSPQGPSSKSPCSKSTTSRSTSSKSSSPKGLSPEGSPRRNYFPQHRFQGDLFDIIESWHSRQATVLKDTPIDEEQMRWMKQDRSVAAKAAVAPVPKCRCSANQFK